MFDYAKQGKYYLSSMVVLLCLSLLLVRPAQVQASKPLPEDNIEKGPVVVKSIDDSLKRESLTFTWKYQENQKDQFSDNESLSISGQDWIRRRLQLCNQRPVEGTLEQQFDCQMLAYTLEGNFTDEEKQKIRSNGGILMAVAETSVEIPYDLIHDDSESGFIGNARGKSALVLTRPEIAPVYLMDSSPKTTDNSNKPESAKVVHPDTGDVLYVVTRKEWWTPNVTHEAYAGVPNQGWTYDRIKLRIARAYNYDETHYNYNTDYQGISKYVGWCCYGGTSVITEAWFKSYAGNEVFAGVAFLQL